jgi:outer membrane receptor protein involved in Fe transport
MASNNLAKGLKRSALTVALGLCFAGGVQAQSTTGSIFGTVPAGSTVVISNDSGLTRTTTADESGRFNFGQLPFGNYTVTSGTDTRNVVVTVRGGANVSFGGVNTLETVVVNGASVTPIDVSTVSTSTVITSEQLKRLPLSHSAEAIALLAPGSVQGNSVFGQNHGGTPISFGGASVGENAYYLNGYYSGTPTTNVGGYSLPYGAIDQQETYTGGYSAKYGRSDGGVISQIGKSGTNEWHFGGQFTYVPHDQRAARPDTFFPDESFPVVAGNQYEYADDDLPGKLRTHGNRGQSWYKTYSAYAGGPILKDRLFGFVAAEVSNNGSEGNPSVDGSPQIGMGVSKDPKVYAKINWNITDNHLLEATYMARKYRYYSDIYSYDFGADEIGDFKAPGSNTKENDEFSILKYTGYLTDNLTFSATYGRQRLSYLSQGGIPPESLDRVGNTNLQNPAYWPAGTDPSRGVTNAQTNVTATDARDYTEGLRAELEWILGDHTLTLGIDDMEFTADNEGTKQVGKRWLYGHTANPNDPLSEELDVGAPGSEYFVTKYTYSTSTSMSLKQKAYYLEDRWQITDNLLLSLGIRNDKFTNYNVAGKPFTDSGNQWAPRLGFSWDVFGDSSFKVFGNAGRYFLALPMEVAVRGASAAYYTNQYFTYSGIDANGVPTGLTPVPTVDGNPAGPGEVSSNNEFGQAKDPATVAASNLQSEYQDEYILGFQTNLGDKWIGGAKLTFRDLKSAIDDFCDPYRMIDKLTADGLIDQVDVNAMFSTYCWLSNPNATNTYNLANVAGDGYVELSMSPEDWAWPSKLKRTYKALDLFVEHPFDGTWEARVDYTYSKSQGNTEGPANTDTGQGSAEHDSGISLSQNWDMAELMAYADGYLANDRRHQLKARASYAISPEWMVSGNLTILSGSPISCFDYYSPDGSPLSDPAGYYASYHTCFGETAPPGKTYTPWTHRLDLGLTYRPAMFDHKMALGVNVMNVLNETHPVYINGAVGDYHAPKYEVSNIYNMPLTYATPRYVMFSASYDW